MKPSAEFKYSNTPIYLPSFLRQYGKEVKDYQKVNWTGALPSYQLQFIDRTQEEEPSPEGPEQVFFPFMGKNCWLWEDEYCLLQDILDRVVEMTIKYKHCLNVGPSIPIYTQESTHVEEFQQDLLSGYFKVYAVLTPKP